MKVKDLLQRLQGMVDRDPDAGELAVYVRANLDRSMHLLTAEGDVFVEKLFSEEIFVIEGTLK